jgi:putative DNA primase/helicase
VTIHQLCTNRFAAAELFGKSVNIGADLSASHVSDISTFKRLTGDDPVQAERKYGQPFMFHNRAVMIFTENDPPTINDVDEAYLGRVHPVEYSTSFAGREDVWLEDRLASELPGLLVGLVRAARAFHERSGYLAPPPETRERFAVLSDAGRLFIEEATRPAPGCFISGRDLVRASDRWSQLNRRQPIGQHRVYAAARAAGMVDGRSLNASLGERGFRGRSLLDEQEWGPP